VRSAQGRASMRARLTQALHAGGLRLVSRGRALRQRPRAEGKHQRPLIIPHHPPWVALERQGTGPAPRPPGHVPLPPSLASSLFSLCTMEQSPRTGCISSPDLARAAHPGFTPWRAPLGPAACALHGARTVHASRLCRASCSSARACCPSSGSLSASAAPSSFRRRRAASAVGANPSCLQATDT